MFRSSEAKGHLTADFRGSIDHGSRPPWCPGVCCADEPGKFFAHVEFLTLARAVGGCGTGLVLGACYFVFGLTDNERYMSACQLGQLVLAFVFMLCTGAIEAGLGWSGLFLVLALLLLPGVLLLEWRVRWWWSSWA